MAVPKRKTSTARRDKRRTHWKMEVLQSVRTVCARFAVTTMVSKLST